MSEEASAPAKADPETLVLRGTPGRVVRFRRGAIIAIAALGSTAIVGAAWVALKPATFRIVAGSDDRGDSGAKAPADALADAPKSYGDVPQLGPPLPGDLGRPILEHQRSLGNECRQRDWTRQHKLQKPSGSGSRPSARPLGNPA